MAKFGGGKKPANQGSAGSAKVQPPATSGVSGKGEAPQIAQNARGYKPAGKGGSGKVGRVGKFKG